jgi:hypothetical protein
MLFIQEAALYPPFEFGACLILMSSPRVNFGKIRAKTFFPWTAVLFCHKTYSEGKKLLQGNLPSEEARGSAKRLRVGFGQPAPLDGESDRGVQR